MPVYTAIFFDLDGTLINTLEDLGASMNTALGHFGLSPWPMDAYRQMVGNGMRKLTERAMGTRFDENTANKLLTHFLEIYDRDCTSRSTIYEGISDLLHQMTAAGCRLYVVTNKTEVQARKIIFHYFGETTFAGVYGNTPGRPTKPDPALTLQLMRESGTLAEQALFVGDSNVDVLTAHNAGIRCAGAAWGFRGEKELTEAGADYIVRHPTEIAALI